MVLSFRSEGDNMSFAPLLFREGSGNSIEWVSANSQRWLRCRWGDCDWYRFPLW